MDLSVWTTRSSDSHFESVYKGAGWYIGCIYRYDERFEDHFESYDVPWGMTASELKLLTRLVECK